MALSGDAPQSDLRSGTSPWQAGLPRPAGEALARDTACDVAIIGGGITGALLAEHLTARGLTVLLVDRERPGFGSTLASTAMLLWEIDLSLHRLAALYGFARAADVYRRSFLAVAGLRELVLGLALPCALIPRDSLYLATAEISPRLLQEERELRERAGLPGMLLDRDRLRGAFGFDRAAAILSPGAAEADPLSLCHALLGVAAARGTRLVRDEAIAFDGQGRRGLVQLASGRVIEAGHIVLATGYVMPECLRSDLHRIVASWALATEPQHPASLWPRRALVWEAAEDYVYSRTTTDGRIVIGGEDEAIEAPELRERLAPEKTRKLLARLTALVPAAGRGIGYAWSGAFGETADGLPLIGRVPGQPRLLAAYGYGGNGITFSFLASRLLGALIAGREERWFWHFAIDRPKPR